MTASAPDNSQSPDQDGEVLRDSDGRLVLKFTRSLKHPIENVWRAIATEQGVRGWWDFAWTIDPRVGGVVAIEMDKTGIITEYNPPRVFEYEQFDKDGIIAGSNMMRWALQADGAKCILVFTHTFPPGVGLHYRILCGWHAAIERVEEVAAGRPTDWETATRDRIFELYEYYKQKPGLKD